MTKDGVTAPAIRRELIASLPDVLAPGGIEMHLQPVVRLADLGVIGYEALARVRKGPRVEPGPWFDAADEVGQRADLELACWRAAIARGAAPDHALMFLNISASTLFDPRTAELAFALPTGSVIEITERDRIDDPAAVRQILEPWLATGLRLAIDDLGAGWSSLEHVMELRPHFVKLTRSLVAGADRSARHRALLRTIKEFADAVGTALVAEGIETSAELEALTDAGIGYGQGFLLGRPLASWSRPNRAEIEQQVPMPRPARSPVVPALDEADSVRSACEAVVAHLARDELLMPSIYIERGGRLRCQAVTGYWQIYDGMPSTAGVIGATYSTGSRHVVGDVRGSNPYLEAVSGVVAEVCVPLRVAGEVIGVVNVESPAPIGKDMPDELERLAGLLAARISELGGVPGESRAQRLARHAAGLAGLVDREAIEQRVVAAACDIIDIGSGMLALTDASGALELRAARGPLAEAFATLGPEQLSAISAWTGAMTSCYTIGEPGGRGFVGHEALRVAGAEAIVALPLGAAEEYAGMLLLADPVPIMLATEDVELLELLCAQATSALGTAAAVAELRDRATRDALTGLRNHATFHTDLETALARGETVTVMILDVDGFKAYNDSGGHQRGDDALRAVAAEVALALGPHGRLYRVGGDEFAAVMWTGDADEAEHVAQAAVESVRQGRPPTISAGVAMARLGEGAPALIARADGAVYAAKASGRDRVVVADG